MSSEESRSEQVVEAYKKRKLAASGLRRIHELIHGFDEEKATDRRLAVIGVIIIVLICMFAYFWPDGETVILP